MLQGAMIEIVWRKQFRWRPELHVTPYRRVGEGGERWAELEYLVLWLRFGVAFIVRQGRVV